MRQSKALDLTTGSILSALTKLAVPIIGTSFVEMAYSLTDMMWLGRVGADAVAAVGAAGFFTWLASAFLLLAKVGAEVGVAQSIGARDTKRAKEFIRHSIQIAVSLGVLYGLFMVIFRRPLIGFFRLGPSIESDARTYLVIVSMSMSCFMLNPVFTAIFNGAGDSTTPFRLNALGLVLNIILDPILILGLGPIPRLETTGAAIATFIAQVTVTGAFALHARTRPELFSGINLIKRMEWVRAKEILRLGLPPAVQNACFASIAMVIARILANWGPLPVAVQQVGSQIESISWLTASGFEVAMSAFVGQNYGARKWERVRKGYFTGLGIVTVWGLFATFLLIFAAEPLFSLFIPEEEAIRYGVVYLRILGLCQLFMCVEIMTAGSFIGHGQSLPPAVVSIGFNLLRIPLALILSSTSLGLEGVWWAITLSSICKGVVLSIWHLRFLNRYAGRTRMSRTVEN